jgi:hypothetical protein
MIIEIEAKVLALMVTKLMHANGTFEDAQRCIADNDFTGLCGVINVAMGVPIDSRAKMGLIFEVGDLVGAS